MTERELCFLYCLLFKQSVPPSRGSRTGETPVSREKFINNRCAARWEDHSLVFSSFRPHRRQNAANPGWLCPHPGQSRVCVCEEYRRCCVAVVISKNSSAAATTTMKN